MKANKKNISIFIIWLVHISGLLGMVFYDLDFFAGYTSLNLFLMSIILFANIKLNNKNQIFALLLIFLIGMLSEFIGVNYGLIFGEYIYGNNLGFKLFGVPFLIGLNWVILTVICANIASILIKSNSIIQIIILGTLLMLFMDFVMEPIAPKLDLWKFNNLVVPTSNYIGWLIISILTQTIYNIQFKEKEFKLSFNLYTAIFIFFVSLNLIL